ncbi:glycosyltransferase family 87 protein [Nocardia thailandica]|uniref:glycosyltransferase family 87 protein n=1 Tax=Nocardia thailandica TaxID=257275 RepID=UPI0002EA01D4|nr:glycosyltransferase family 87 protein [Nocardia thailandica]
MPTSADRRTGRGHGSAPTPARIASLILWPLAVVTAADTVFIKAIHGDYTNDYRPVYAALDAFVSGLPVYTANLASVDPHYLYPPGGTLLLSPLTVFDEPTGRVVFLFANAAAAVAATGLLLRMFGYSHRSVVAPCAYFALFASEALINTLTFGNINGLLLLAEVVFLESILARRNIAAGVVLGLTIAIKPILAPLLLIPAVRRQWSTIPTALAIPALTTAIAWPLAADPGTYFVHNLPYSLRVRDYFNSSISGMAAYYGFPTLPTLLIRAALALCVAISLWLLYRYHRHDELFFVTTAAGVLLAAEFALSSLGQQYYSLFLAPLLLTLTLRNSLLRTWPAWLAVFGFATYDSWLLHRWPALGRNLEYSRATFGWTLLLLVIFCVLTDQYLAARREHRTHHGIDPLHLAPDYPRPDLPRANHQTTPDVPTEQRPLRASP